MRSLRRLFFLLACLGVIFFRVAHNKCAFLSVVGRSSAVEARTEYEVRVVVVLFASKGRTSSPNWPWSEYE